MNIEIRDVTKDNWKECISLSVLEEQKSFVASNVFSLAQSKFDTEMVPVCIYENNKMIGFAMYAKEPETGRIWIVRFMIDKQYQNKGLGKLALKELISLLQNKFHCMEIYLSYEPDNIIAEKLYSNAGFIKTGEIEEGEMVSKLNITG